MINCICR